MSEIESYKGKLIPVDCGELSLDEKIQEITGASTLPKWCDNWLEYLYDEKWKEYFFDSNSNVLYKVEKEELQLDYFAVGEKKEHGSYEFAVSFYNGGCGLEEVLEDAIKDAESKDA